MFKVLISAILGYILIYIITCTWRARPPAKWLDYTGKLNDEVQDPSIIYVYNKKLNTPEPDKVDG